MDQPIAQVLSGGKQPHREGKTRPRAYQDKVLAKDVRLLLYNESLIASLITDVRRIPSAIGSLM